MCTRCEQIAKVQTFSSLQAHKMLKNSPHTLTSLIPLITHAAALTNSLPVVQETANCLSISLLICKRCSGVHQQNVCSSATEVKGPGWWRGPASLTSEGSSLHRLLLLWYLYKIKWSGIEIVSRCGWARLWNWNGKMKLMECTFFFLSDSFSWFPFLIFLPRYCGAVGGKRASLPTAAS